MRTSWIDFAKGICMSAIILDHTESYYIDTHHVLQYNWYVVNVLLVFFFISGYLFYKNEKFDLKHKIISICKRLLLPYFIFTSLIAFPKAIIHGQSTEFIDIAKQIILGQASWFVSALIISEILFALLIKISKGNHYIMAPICILAFFANYLFKIPNIPFWTINQSLLVIGFLYAGYLFHHKEIFLKTVHIFVLLPLIILLKYIETKDGINMILYPLDINNYLFFIIDSILCCWIIISISHKINKNKAIEWIGSHSLVYYFLCGGIPYIIGKSITCIGFSYDGQYYRVLIVFLFNMIGISIVTYLIYKYIPFITGNKR
jgi:fucose 4-O-acetylase-like acetyltransferase